MGRRRRYQVIGLLSGTSADGVDAALISIGPTHEWTLRAFISVSYPKRLRQRVLSACAPGGADAAELSQLAVVLGQRFAQAAKRVTEAAGIGLEKVDLIGSHGQTLFHGPHDHPPSTLQVGDAATIAFQTGRTTIADFRTSDMAAGGEGAPLVPLTHWVLFGSEDGGRAVINLGGIANVTVLPDQAHADEILAFDTGPANMVMDTLMREISGGRSSFDRGGRLARQGTVNPSLLDELLAHPFFRKRPPKSTGRHEFGESFARSLLQAARRRKLSDADAMATAAELTVESIARAFERFAIPHADLDDVLVCGGGVRNRYLMARLRDRLARLELPCDTTEVAGVDPDAVEAVAFALLAYETWCGRPGNVPAATGAETPRVLGAIYPGDNFARLRRRL